MHIQYLIIAYNHASFFSCHLNQYPTQSAGPLPSLPITPDNKQKTMMLKREACVMINHQVIFTSQTLPSIGSLKETRLGSVDPFVGKV